MITVEEVLKGRAKFEELPEEHRANITTLLSRINQVRAKYGKPMKVNDGLRIGTGGSNHFRGAAIDIDDDDAGTFWKWCFQNLAFIAKVGLWLEHPCWTHCDGMSWMHFQIVPPASGKRVFVPSARPNPNPSFWDGVYDHKLDSP